MKSMKKILAVLLAVMLMVPSMSVFAASDSPETIDFANAVVTIKSKTYDGKQYTREQVQANTTVTLNGKTLPSSDYRVTIKTHTNVGTYEAAIRPANAKYTISTSNGKVTQNYKIVKAANPATNKTVSSKRGKTITVTQPSGTGKATHAYISGKANQKYFKLKGSGSSVKVTIKSNCPKKTYKLVVSYAGDKNHKAAKKTITIKVK